MSKCEEHCCVRPLKGGTEFLMPFCLYLFTGVQKPLLILHSSTGTVRGHPCKTGRNVLIKARPLENRGDILQRPFVCSFFWLSHMHTHTHTPSRSAAWQACGSINNACTALHQPPGWDWEWGEGTVLLLSLLEVMTGWLTGWEVWRWVFCAGTIDIPCLEPMCFGLNCVPPKSVHCNIYCQSLMMSPYWEIRWLQMSLFRVSHTRHR